MSRTISQGRISQSCPQCTIVDTGGYDEDYRITLCPLHAAAPELLAAAKRAEIFCKINDSTGRIARQLHAAILKAEGR